MPDEHLRDLEGQAAQGDIRAQARLLLERVRVGDLDEKMLRLAAHLGDQAAQQAISINKPLDSDPKKWIRGYQKLEDWVRGCATWGGRKHAHIRAAIVTVEFVLEFYETAFSDNIPRLAIEATKTWIRCPCEKHKNQTVRASVAAREAAIIAGTRSAWAAESVAEAGAWTADSVLWQQRTISAKELQSTSAGCAGNAAREAIATLNMTSSGADPNGIRGAIASALIPWALGEGDPILENPTPAEPPPPEGTD